MTTDTEHTYSFYLLVQNRIRRDILDNNTARRQVNSAQNTNTALLDLINKYKSNKKTSDKINSTISDKQATTKRLNSEYNILQSETDRLTAYLNNNDDIAGRAYDAAYTPPVIKPKITPRADSIFMRLRNLLTRRTK